MIFFENFNKLYEILVNAFSLHFIVTNQGVSKIQNEVNLFR